MSPHSSASLSLLVRAPVLLVVLTANAGAATLTVGASGDYATLAEAVAAASDGDILELDSDTYATGADLISVSKSLTLRSTKGALDTAPITPIRVESADLTLEGITVETMAHEGGVWPGVNLTDGILLATDLRVAPGTPGTRAVHLQRASGSEITDLHGTAVNSGVLYVLGDGDPNNTSVTLTGCEFTGSNFGGNQQALMFNRVTATVSACNFEDVSAGSALIVAFESNLSYTGGTMRSVGASGIQFQQLLNVGNALTVDDSTFEKIDGTKSFFGGGAIGIGGSGKSPPVGMTVAIKNSTFRDNVGRYGADIYYEDDLVAGQLTLTDSTFDNSESSEGGSLAAWGTVVGRDLTFTETRTVASADWDGTGGAIDLWGKLDCERCAFDGTSSDNGGAIYVWAYNQHNTELGDYTTRLKLVDSTFTNTVARVGGAISREPLTVVNVSDTTFTDVLADEHGGVLYEYDPWGVLGGVRRAAEGDVAEIVAQHPAVFSGVTITGAQADASGGAFSVHNQSHVVVGDTTATDVSGGVRGGFAYLAGVGVFEMNAVDVTTSTAVLGGFFFAGDGHIDFLGTQGADVRFRDGRIDDASSAKLGGAFYLGTAASLDLQDSHLQAVHAASEGGAVYGNFAESVSLQCTRLCDAQATEGAAVRLDGVSESIFSDLTVRNSVVLNSGDGNTLFAHSAFRSTVRFEQNTIIAPDAERFLGVTDRFSSTNLRGNVVDGSAKGVAAAGSLKGDFNLWNVSGTINPQSVFPAANDVVKVPSYFEPPNSCEARLDLASGSPGVDVGPSGSLDVDGSPADIGAFGGPDACFLDADGDGSTILDDCNDADPAIYPGATDTPYDGIDQDCSGEDFCDIDGDGEASTACGGPDCNDADAEINGAATEVPYDGIDQDCTGSDACDLDGDGVLAPECGGTDCNDDEVLTYPGAADLCYDGVDSDCAGDDDFDCDGDGTIPDGYDDVYDGDLPAGDCEDDDASVYPGADDPSDDGVDQDCDGTVECDVDGDGYDNATCGGDDCDDDDAGINPGATEVAYDGLDQDCTGADLCDVDGDGSDAEACGGEDCDDDDAARYPGATEVPYDDIDQDCDSADLCDVDGDGVDAEACGGTDCDDEAPDVFPDATDTPDDGIDQDCDGEDLVTDDESPIDEGTAYVKGGCASVPTSPGSGLGGLALLALAGLRRRKEG